MTYGQKTNIRQRREPSGPGPTHARGRDSGCQVGTPGRKPSGRAPPPRFGETTRLFPPAPRAESGPTVRTLCRTQAAHSPRTQAPRGRPQGRRVSIPQCLETDRKQTGSPGVTAGFRFPRRHSRFPGERSCPGDAAEGLPFLLPRRCRGRHGRLVGCGPGGSGRRAAPRPRAEPLPKKTGYPASSAPAQAARRAGETPQKGRREGGRRAPETRPPVVRSSEPGPSGQTGSQARGSTVSVREAGAGAGSEGAVFYVSRERPRRGGRGRRGPRVPWASAAGRAGRGDAGSRGAVG